MFVLCLNFAPNIYVGLLHDKLVIQFQMKLVRAHLTSIIHELDSNIT